jgi:uncharacterized protein (DUF2461 family)
MKNKILKDIYNEIKIFLVDNSFVKQHIKISKFLTKAWIEKETDKKTIENLFMKNLKRIKNDVFIEGNMYNYNEEKTDHLEQMEYLNSHLIDFYVVSKKGDTFILSAIWKFETEFEVGIKRIIENDSIYEYRHEVNSRTGELEMDMVFIPSHIVGEEYIYKNCNPLFFVKYEIILENRKVRNYKLTGIDLL